MFIQQYNLIFYDHRETAWDIHCKGVLLMQFGQMLYVTSIIVKHPDDGHNSDQTCRWKLIHDKAYFIIVHLLVYYISVNIS